MNFAPRAGFAWTVDRAGTTVVRGGVGVFHRRPPHALFQNAVARPFTPVRQGWNRTELEARGIGWPAYPEDANAIAIRDSGGKKNLYYMFQTDMKSPENRAGHRRPAAADWKTGVGFGWLRPTSGKNLPILLNFALAYDRVTGARPNPDINPGGWYITSGQTMNYNAFEGNARLSRFHGVDAALHYTLSKGWSQQGANLIGNFNSSIGADTYNNTAGLLQSLPGRRLLAAGRRGASSRRRHGDLRHPVAAWPQGRDRRRAGRVAAVQRAQLPNGRTAAHHPGVGHWQQPAGLQRRDPGVRQLARHAAVPSIAAPTRWSRLPRLRGRRSDRATRTRLRCRGRPASVWT